MNNKKYQNNGFRNYYTFTNKTNSSKGFQPKTSKNSNNENEDYKEMTLKNNFNNIKLSKYNNAPDINLIVDESDDKYIKIIDENEYTKLKKKNAKSSRPINIMTKQIRDSNHRLSNYKDRLDFFGFYNFGTEKSNLNNQLRENFKNTFSPRILLYDNKNKIMPPNEI